MFQSTNVSAAHPAMRIRSRTEGPYEALTKSRGTKATSSVRPLPPSHPAESNAADNDTHNNFRNIFGGYCIKYAAKIRLSERKSKLACILPSVSI